MTAQSNRPSSHAGSGSHRFHRGKSNPQAQLAPDIAAQNAHLVDTQAGLHDLLAALQGESVVAFDTEFHSERTYVPKLMLVQLATAQGIWLVDPLALDLRPLVAALAEPGRLIVGHALRNDLRILWQVYGLTLGAVFDTQLAAAFLGHGLQVGLSHLVHRTLHIHLPKGEQMANWAQRPLPDKLRHYAAGDVAHLLQLHHLLSEQLQERGRLGWVHAECASLIDAGAYDRDPAAAGDRVAGARKLDPREGGVLYALATVREIIAQEEDVIPHFLLPDETLLILAKLQPRHVRDLQGDRRLQQRAVQRYAGRWVDAVEGGLTRPLQREPARPPPAAEVEAVAALAMLLVGEVAQREGVAQPLLTKRDTLLEALREKPSTPEHLATIAGLHGWRGELLLTPLWRFLQGQLRVQCRPDPELGVRLHFADFEAP